VNGAVDLVLEREKSTAGGPRAELGFGYWTWASFCDELDQCKRSGRCAEEKQRGWEGRGRLLLTGGREFGRRGLLVRQISDDESRRLAAISREREKGGEGGAVGGFIGAGWHAKGARVSPNRRLAGARCSGRTTGERRKMTHGAGRSVAREEPDRRGPGVSGKRRGWRTPSGKSPG
jgi:hypothetical protein